MGGTMGVVGKLISLGADRYFLVGGVALYSVKRREPSPMAPTAVSGRDAPLGPRRGPPASEASTSFLQPERAGAAVRIGRCPTPAARPSLQAPVVPPAAPARFAEPGSRHSG